jgi:protein tyrosine phosphatase
MKSSIVESAPSWLASVTPSHFNSVCQILEEREARRNCARLVSRLTSKVSRDEHRSPHNLFGFLKLGDNANLQSRYSVAIAELPENMPHNRYMDIAPYDRTRVVVGRDFEEPSEGEQHKLGDYLNASWVLERYGHKWWIATQAPLPVSTHAFLSLFLQPIPCLPKSFSSASSSSPRMSRLRTIVQLTQNLEGGRRKADVYFPNQVGKSLIVSPEPGTSKPALKVALLREQLIKEARCVHSTISITPLTQSRLQLRSPTYGRSDDLNDKDDEEDKYGEEGEGEVITIQHLLYTAWPDHGVPEPEDQEGLLAFLHLVDRTNRDEELDPDPPIVVGCSAGVGRTGTFIALSSLLRHYGLLPPATNPMPSDALPRSPLGILPRILREDLVAQEIDSLREQRPAMVQREEQIRLLYEILGAAL